MYFEKVTYRIDPSRYWGVWMVALFALLGNAMPSMAQTEVTTYVEALVLYGDSRLVDTEEALTDEQLNTLLDSLCTLDKPPQELVRDLRLFQRIRQMDQHEMVLLIDSLFELEEVPYALVNEINLYVDQLPSQDQVNGSSMLAWCSNLTAPGGDIYGEWNTTNPNAYSNLPLDRDTLIQLRLTDPKTACGYRIPIPPVITSRFGWRDGRAHNGVDLDLEVWDTVRTAFPGVVRFAGTYGGFGRLVVVRHFNGLETFYAHLHRIKVQPGDEVDGGQLVGLGGSSGHSTGSHLHFETRFRGVPLDPAHIIDLTTGNLLCDTLVIKQTRLRYTAYPKGTRFHTVAKGEHLSMISETYGVPVDAICYLNGLPERARLRVGQRLMVLPISSVDRLVDASSSQRATH